MWYYPLSGLINGITLTLLGFFVYFNQRRKLTNITYAIFCIFISLWSYAYFLWQISRTYESALFWCKILMLGAIFIPATYFHFITTLIETQSTQMLKKTTFFAYLLAFIFLCFNFTPYMTIDVKPRLKFLFWPTAGPIYKYFLLYFSFYASYGCYLIMKEMKHSSRLKRNQFIYILVGSLIGYIGGATNFPLWYDIKLYPVGNILSSIYVALIGYAIIKYQLMDIKVALTRASIFTFVYSLVLGIPFGLAVWGETWLISIFGHSWFLWPMLILLVLASFGPYFYTHLHRRAEDILLKDQRRYQQTLIELSRTMTRIRDIDRLFKTIVVTVIDNVGVPFAATYLKDIECNSYHRKHFFPKKDVARFQEYIPLDDSLVKVLLDNKRPVLNDEITHTSAIKIANGLVIPCFIEGSLLSFLVLGPKPDNRMYTPEDILIFETLSYSTALAIENSMFWKEIEERQRQARLHEMDTFSYSVAHEIGNPIAIIKGQGGLLKSELLKEVKDDAKRTEITESCDFILEAAERVAGMVDAIQEFGKKSTGELKPLQFTEVVESFEKLYTPEFKSKGVHFYKENSKEFPLIRGNKTELMQVLVILANNATHALLPVKDRRASLTITPTNHKCLRIAFTDNGYGIAPENLSIIFKAFVTSKASTEGTGMGLYNAQKIIQRHHGRIWAESEGKDKGATFIFEIPIATDISPDELSEKRTYKRIF